jgi:type II secretory pathway predicted ATPase ExeA/septal ring-binding cell division protein DamX
MYLSHFGLNEPPFRITPHTDFFFEGANRGATLEALLYAILHDEGIVKVSGEVGSGKTMLCRVLMERLPDNVETIYLSNPSLNRDEILYAIAEELEIKVGDARTTLLLRTLQDHLIKLFGSGRRVVVLIDEAHAMPSETLEEIRLLSNLETNRHKLLQIVLFGQPELDEQLNTPGMRQLKERITHSFRLEPLVRNDIESYIDFRMRAAGYRGPNVFAPAAMRLIANASEGLSRRINILCDKSLLAAFADNVHHVAAKQARAAIRDSEFYKPVGRNRQRWWIAAAGVAAGLALGFAAQLVFQADRAQSTLQAQSGLPAGTAQQTASSPQKNTTTEHAAASTPQAVATPDAKPVTSNGTAALAVPVVPAQSAAPPSVAALQTAPAPVAAPTPIPAAPAAAALPKPAPQAVTAASSENPTAPAAGKLMRERFAATQKWLPTAPGDQYSIQLLMVGPRDLRRIEDLLLRVPSRKLRIEDFYVYSVKINDQQHYRLAYGLYPSAEEAIRAIRELPPVYRAFTPFQRSVERMKSQNRQ